MKIVCQTFIWFLLNEGKDLKELKAKTVFDSLAVITDPRLERHKRHSLIDILVIALCASICGAEGWEDIEESGMARHEWSATFIELKNQFYPLPLNLPERNHHFHFSILLL
ncbi:MAG: transposase family protein [Acidobacteriota bacterium]|nr:transposase family protein [Acidobacteriota bacterium]